jgi:hypothetical protein
MTYPPDMDPACIPLCDELNALPGLRTFESCEGHGKHPFRVFFTAEKIESLAPLLETLSNGWPWLVEAEWCWSCLFRARRTVRGCYGLEDVCR